MFRHIQNPVQSTHIQKPCIFRILAYLKPGAYSEPWHIQNSGIFRTMAYSESWYIQNPAIFATRDLYRTLENLKPYDRAFLRKYLPAKIIFAISPFHVLYFMKQITCLFFFQKFIKCNFNNQIDVFCYKHNITLMTLVMACRKRETWDSRRL